MRGLRVMVAIGGWVGLLLLSTMVAIRMVRELCISMLLSHTYRFIEELTSIGSTILLSPQRAPL